MLIQALHNQVSASLNSKHYQKTGILRPREQYEQMSLINIPIFMKTTVLIQLYKKKPEVTTMMIDMVSSIIILVLVQTLKYFEMQNQE